MKWRSLATGRIGWWWLIVQIPTLSCVDLSTGCPWGSVDGLSVKHPISFKFSFDISFSKRKCLRCDVSVLLVCKWHLVGNSQRNLLSYSMIANGSHHGSVDTVSSINWANLWIRAAALLIPHHNNGTAHQARQIRLFKKGFNILE